MIKKETTLQNVKDNIALDRLAMECIVIKSKKPDPIERPDLLAYYQTHPDLFTFEAKVKWQQIQIMIPSPGNDASKREAREKLQKAIAELNRKVPFEQVAKKYSEGPTAKDGGAWDWMTAGNLADTSLEKKLFSMPVRTVSEIHEGPNSLSVVMVTERQTAGRKPFGEVQAEIRQMIENQQNQTRAQEFLKEVFANAVIETTYSLPQFAPAE